MMMMHVPFIVPYITNKRQEVLRAVCGNLWRAFTQGASHTAVVHVSHLCVQEVPSSHATVGVTPKKSEASKFEELHTPPKIRLLRKPVRATAVATRWTICARLLYDHRRTQINGIAHLLGNTNNNVHHWTRSIIKYFVVVSLFRYFTPWERYVISLFPLFTPRPVAASFLISRVRTSIARCRLLILSVCDWLFVIVWFWAEFLTPQSATIHLFCEEPGLIKS